MTTRGGILESYIALIERIANGRNRLIDFGEGMSFYRGEIHIIKRIGDNPGLFSAEVARSFNVTRAVIHKTLLKLEERGLVCKGEDRENQKRLPLYLTEEGQKAYRLHAEYHDREDRSFLQFLDELNDEEKGLVKEFLKRANEMIARHF